MKAANSWTTYRTRFLVKAKQLTADLTFTDVLGRQHSGSKGDYLVESSEGVLRIASRQIFEDVYVPLLVDEVSAETQIARKPDMWERREIPAKRQTQNPPHPNSALRIPPHLARKSPQAYRQCNPPVPGLRSL